MRNTWVLSALLLTTSCVSVVNGNQPTSALSLLNLPIGEQRSAVLAAAEQQWGTQASCNTTRTGVGMTRRAYFLETCVLSNEQGMTLYDETPASATYQFLENQLVQVSYEFSQLQDPATFSLRAEQDAAKLKAQSTDADAPTKLGVTIAEDFSVSVSDVEMVDQIHALRSTP